MGDLSHSISPFLRGIVGLNQCQHFSRVEGGDESPFVIWYVARDQLMRPSANSSYHLHGIFKVSEGEVECLFYDCLIDRCYRQDTQKLTDLDPCLLSRLVLGAEVE
jgi:hypothetical protein